MKKYIFIVLSFLAITNCKKDDFPVPPASTVPNFTFTLDNDALAPTTATFTSTSIVPSNVGNATYYWNFGDSTSAEGANPVHIYTHPGAYTVRLVITTDKSLEVKEAIKTLVVKDPSATGIPIYFTDGALVFSGLVNTQTPIMSELAVSGLSDSYGMYFDTVGNKLYVSDYDLGTIFRCNPDGSGQEVFRSGIDSPNAMRIDYQGNHLYWDTGTGVQRANLSSTDVNQREDFVTGQANDPDGIAIDPVNRVLYWINYNGGLWKKNLDGSGEAMLNATPEGGSIIVANNRIYYDHFIASGDIHIKSADLSGGDVATIATGVSRVVYALAYEAAEQKIYWGDRNKGTIMRANLDGSNATPFFVLAGSSPRGLCFGKRI